MELGSGDRNHVWCGLQADQRGQGGGGAFRLVFYVFQSLLKITIYLLFVDFGVKVLLKKFCEFFWLELHQYGEKGRLAITCISGHITNTTS